MTDIERLNGFTKEYIELMGKYRLKMDYCCCASINDFAGDSADEFYSDISSTGSAYVDDKVYKLTHKIWVEKTK